MKTYKLIQILENFCPKTYACDWDNVGLIVGNDGKEVYKVVVTVDVDDAAIMRAVMEKADMIIAHHPLIFHGQKVITNENAIGRRILTMIENGISCYCMHTNFDSVGGMATEAARRIGISDLQILDMVTEKEGIGRFGILPIDMTMKELCEKVKKEFNLSQISYYGDKELLVSKVAIVPGSGKDMVDKALSLDADVFISGDISYHIAIDAVSEGMQIIDAGHYGLEHIFMDIMEKFLVDSLIDVQVVRMKFNNPQKYI